MSRLQTQKITVPFTIFIRSCVTVRAVTDETQFSSYRSYSIRIMWPAKVPYQFLHVS